MFSIYDGRDKFYQWDKDRKLIVEDKAITQVHFANCLCADAQVCEVKDGLVDVPNELLTQDLDIRAWGYDGEMTKHEEVFEVEKRTKPADYIFTQTEVWTAEKAVEEALEEAKANGDFKGDKGDKGDAGAINFKAVSELPETGSGDSIYLVPNPTGENNNFDEFIWQDGQWELIGSAGVEVNLDEYVKKTDYPTGEGATAGVVRVRNNNYCGLTVNDKGELAIYSADEKNIDAKSNYYKPIVPKHLDYAVKSGLTANALEWTDDEKAAARGLIGAVGTTDYPTTKTPGVITVNPSYGISVYDNNQLAYISRATEDEIAGKSNKYKPIVPSNLDYAVKQALTNPINTTWTEEEKAAVRALLGIE